MNVNQSYQELNSEQLQQFNTALVTIESVAENTKLSTCYVRGDAQVLNKLNRRGFKATTCWVKAHVSVYDLPHYGNYWPGIDVGEATQKSEAICVSLDNNYNGFMQKFWNQTFYHKKIYPSINHKDYPEKFNLFDELNRQ